MGVWTNPDPVIRRRWDERVSSFAVVGPCRQTIKLVTFRWFYHMWEEVGASRKKLSWRSENLLTPHEGSKSGNVFLWFSQSSNEENIIIRSYVNVHPVMTLPIVMHLKLCFSITVRDCQVLWNIVSFYFIGLNGSIMEWLYCILEYETLFFPQFLPGFQLCVHQNRFPSFHTA